MSNLIAASLSAEKSAAARTKIEELRGLLPFLLALPAGSKRGRRVMGQKSVEYVNLALRGARSFGDYLPAGFETAGFEQDVELISTLWDLRVPLAALLEALDDTLFAASVDAMAQADEVYDYLRSAARRDAAVKAHVDEMRKRFVRRYEKTPPPADKPAEG